MGEEDSSIFAKGSAWVAPRLTSGKSWVNAARARWKQSAALRHLPDRHVDMGAGPGAARGCSVCPLPGAFQQRWSRSGGDSKGSGQLPLFQGLRGGWREEDKGTLLGGGAGARGGSDSRAGRKTCRMTGAGGPGVKSGHKSGCRPPRVTHHPLGLHASAEDPAATKSSSSGRGVGAKALETAGRRRADSAGRGQGRQGRRRARGGRLGRRSWRIRFQEEEHRF